MPLVGFIHPITRVKGGFDMFEGDTSKNGRPAYPPWLATLVANKARNDKRHSGLAITNTRTMSCPREVFIEDLLEYRVDPMRRYVMDRGTAGHVTMADNWDPEHYISETDARRLCTIEGEIFGVTVSTQIDALRVDGDARKSASRIVEIIDGKFPKDWSVVYRDKQGGRAKPEHSIQLNISRLLLAQQPWAIDAGYDPDRVDLTIWDHAMGKFSAAEPLTAEYMTEDQMASYLPWQDRAPSHVQTYSIRDIVRLMAQHRKQVEDVMVEEDQDHVDTAGGVEAKEEIIASLPLVGQAFFGGKKCVELCDVEGICSGLVRKYGAP
ncbi:MAG: hypothetical protein V3S43_06465 [Acidimicrobiia bacterium]